MSPYLKLLTGKNSSSSLKKTENDYLRRRLALKNMLKAKIMTKGEYYTLSNKLYDNLKDRLIKSKAGKTMEIPGKEELDKIKYRPAYSKISNPWQKSADMNEVLFYLTKEGIIMKEDYNDLISRLKNNFIKEFIND